MESDTRPGLVVYAVDAAKMAEFYEKVLGLGRSRAEADFLVLESPALQLIVQRIPEAIAATIGIETPPLRREETPLKAVFPVPSIEEARARAARYGGVVDAQDRAWTFEGRRVCDGHDPEGNVFQLREG